MTNGYTGEKGTVASMRDKIDLRNFLSLNSEFLRLEYRRYLTNLGKSGKRGAELFLVGKKVIYGGNIYVCKQIDFTGKFPALTISSQNKGDEILELNMLQKYVYPPDGLKKIDIGISIPQNLVTHEFVFFRVNVLRATLYLASDVQETVEFENRVKNYFIKKYMNVRKCPN